MKKKSRELRNDLSRAFITLKTGNLATETKYIQSIAIDSFQQSKDGVIRIEVPNPLQYQRFIDLGGLQGSTDRLTTTLSTNMIRTDKSLFYGMFENKQVFDLHIHTGQCGNPSDFYSFDKAIILKDVLITNFNTDPLTIKQSSDRALVTESIDISLVEKLDFTQLKFKCVNEFVGDVLSKIVLLPDLPCINGLCNSCFCMNISVMSGVAPIAGTAILDNDLLVVQSGGVVAKLDIDNILTNNQVGYTYPFDLNTNLLTVSSNNDIALIGGINGFLILLDRNLNQLNLSGTTLNNITASNVGDNCYLIGTANGELYFSKDGETFSSLISPTINEISTLLCYNENNYIIGTTLGEVFYYTNNSWIKVLTKENGPVKSLTRCGLSNLYFVMDNDLYFSYDYGKHWRIHTFDELVSIDSVICCERDINKVYITGLKSNGNSVIYQSY